MPMPRPASRRTWSAGPKGYFAYGSMDATERTAAAAGPARLRVELAFSTFAPGQFNSGAWPARPSRDLDLDLRLRRCPGPQPGHRGLLRR